MSHRCSGPNQKVRLAQFLIADLPVNFKRLRMPNTIWIVSELFAPDDAATAHLMTQIAEGLAAESEGSQYSVSVICAQPTYTSRGQKASRREIINGVQINRCWSTTFSKDRLMLRAVNVVTIMMTFFVKMLFRFRRGDRVLVVTNPPPLPFVATLAAKLRGARSTKFIQQHLCQRVSLNPPPFHIVSLISQRAVCTNLSLELSRLDEI